MAKIPQYVSSATPTAEAPQVQVNPENFGQAGRDLQTVGKAVDSVGSQMQQLDGLTQLTQANSFAQTKLREVRSTAMADPDLYKNQEKYSSQIDQIHQDALGMINDNLYKAELDRRLGTSVAVNQFDVRQAARQNLINTSKASMLQTVGALSDNYINSSNPLDRQDLVNQIHQTIDDQVSAGTLKADVAQKFKDTTMKNLMDKQVLHDMDQDPATTLQNLNSGSYGQLPYGDKTKYVSMAEQSIERAAKVAKLQLTQTQNTNEVQMLSDLNNQKLNTAQIETSLVQAGVSNDFGKWALKAASSPKTVDAQTDPEVYNKVIDKYLSPKSTPQDLRTMIVKGMAEGDISKDDVESLTKMQQLQQDPVAKQQFNTGMMMIRNAADKLSTGNDTLKHEMTKDYLYRTLSGESSAAATHSVYKDAVYKQFPSTGLQDNLPNKVATASKGLTSLLPQSGPTAKADYKIQDGKIVPKSGGSADGTKTGGKLMMDASGHKAMVYSDGSYDEVQ